MKNLLKTATADTILLRSSEQEFLNLNIYDANYHLYDELDVHFNDLATDNEDRKYDCGHPMNPDFNFYCIGADNSKLTVNELPYQNGKIIPIGLRSDYQQDFIIRVDNLGNIPAGGSVYLHDKFLNTYTFLAQGTEYRFAITGNAASQGEQRFELGLQPAGTAIAAFDVVLTPNPAANEVNLTYSAPASGDTKVSIIDITGQVVMVRQLGDTQKGTIALPVKDLAAGIYLVELNCGSNKVVQKLVKE